MRKYLQPLAYHFFKDFKTKLSVLDGVGPKKEVALVSAGIKDLGALLFYKPRKYIDRTTLAKSDSLIEGENIQSIGEVKNIKELGGGKGKRLIVTVFAADFFIDLTFFRYNKWLKDHFTVDNTIFFTGKLKFFNGWQIVHPEFEIMGNKDDKTLIQGIVPFYRIPENLKKAKIDSRFLRKMISQAFDLIDKKSPDYYPQKVADELKIGNFFSALYEIHFPTSRPNYFKAQNRLKVDEILPLLFLLSLRKQTEKKDKSFDIKITKKDIDYITKLFPFKFTTGQESVIEAVIMDIKEGKIANRLIQGDVGSGKTAVAFFFMILFSGFGYQSVMMAPTEVLAKQHYYKLKELLFGLNFPIFLLTGSTTAKEKREIKGIIATGQSTIIIGTHALIEDDVVFNNLGFVIVDEQHRFGVDQRLKLIKKNKSHLKPHIIYMTATPIPRTIVQTLYGDLDTSIIDTMPMGRIPITTGIVFENKMGKMFDFIKKEIDSGRQVYFIYPLVNDSDKIDLKSAIVQAEEMSEVHFKGYSVGLLHGKLKGVEKDKILTDFKKEKYQILVSTTVVEVGVDVPNATIMVIENAERFGLSQLHQLRGRVGRGSYKSYCFLLPSPTVADDSMERLRVMGKMSSGFDLSEEDMKLRGPGEFTGIRQSGITEFNYINLVKDVKMISNLRKFITIYINDKNRDEKFIEFVKQYLVKEYKGKILQLDA